MMFLRARPCHLALIAIAVVPLWATAQRPSTRPDIDSIFTQWITPDAPGCAVDVYEGDRVIYANGYGLANVEHGACVAANG